MSNRTLYRKKSSYKKYLGILGFLMVVGAIGFVYFSPMFEQNKPKISFEDKQFWNLKSPLVLALNDDTGLQHYRVTYMAKGQEVVLDTKVVSKTKTSAKVQILPPLLNAFNKQDAAKLKIEVTDISKWNFLNGNVAVEQYDINIDTIVPKAEVIANSYAIRRGGSAVVVVYVHDSNLKEAYISFNQKKKFRLIPFYKENYFAALIGWDVNIEQFERVNLVALDKAKNSIKIKVPLYIRELKHKRSKLNISDKFVDKASKVVLQHMHEPVPNNQSDAFVKVNKDIRAQNVDFLRDIGLTKLNTDGIDDFKIKPFVRLKGSRQVGNYADRRDYSYDGKKIDEAWHLGIDWASVKHAKIYSSNAGEVIFQDYLGIYGNTIIIDHGLGMMSLYAHTSSSDIKVGHRVKAGQKIANTGATGAVFGDHLHFGILIQGIEVNPAEWMDKEWIKTRITNILAEAKKVINRHE
ncbi:MAG: M23 family metallopeptidase [Campylobacterota bacterium]|nr:M23 family metallopeptidase [Campylobacterota bacterium]